MGTGIQHQRVLPAQRWQHINPLSGLLAVSHEGERCSAVRGVVPRAH
jgi:hypothetical protein